MAIGDKSAQSYGWNWTLREPVEDSQNVVVPTPGLDLRYTDTEYAEVTVASNGAVWRTGKGKVDVVFEMNEDDPRATVTNHSGAIWPLGDQLYLFCPHMLGEGANEYDLKGKIYDLEQRMAAFEETPASGEDLTARMDALEEGFDNLEARIVALESADPASKWTLKR